ncbi:MAG: TolC family protein [Campylobacter sp.]|uniref:TolC family protein n=1 Tax=Campylobacter sp. TaxID=205 RepID=UPI002AA865C9|nr:TolC family protein [Campylobacter sp.]MCI7549440.1 TolC family protein [Campylobacter sp.]
MKYIFLAFLAFFMTACATLNYDPKDIKRDYNATWQYNFNIAELDSLIAEALKNNEDLETASLNLYQAMLRANIALSDLAPTPSASTRASSNRDIKAGGTSARSFTADVSLSWELDIFGRIYDAYESARFGAIASLLNLEDVRESLVNSVISAYFNILYLNEQKANLLVNYENMLKLHEIVKIKESLGREEPLALSQSAENLLSLQNSLNNADKDLNASFESLKNLTRTQFLPSAKISEISLPKADLGTISAENNDGELNISWLSRLSSRPDVNMALAQLNAGFYDYKASQKEFLPRINLGGALSSSSDKISDAYTFNLLSGNVSISLPFLNFYKLRQNLKISEAEFNKLRLNYEKTLANAINEALRFASDYELDSRSLLNSENIITEREKILAIYEQKYSLGRAELKDLLSAQNDLLSAKNSLANMKYQVLRDLIGFYKASAY